MLVSTINFAILMNVFLSYSKIFYYGTYVCTYNIRAKSNKKIFIVMVTYLTTTILFVDRLADILKLQIYVCTRRQHLKALCMLCA